MINNNGEITLDTRLYDIGSIMSAMLMLLDKAYVLVKSRGKDEITVQIVPRTTPGQGASEDWALLEFIDEVTKFAFHNKRSSMSKDRIKLMLHRAVNP